MGCCLSKADHLNSSTSLSLQTQKFHEPKTLKTEIKTNKPVSAPENDEKQAEEAKTRLGSGGGAQQKKKEVFLIQHRKSNDRRSDHKGSTPNSSYSDSDSDSDGLLLTLPSTTTNSFEPAQNASNMANFTRSSSGRNYSGSIEVDCYRDDEERQSRGSSHRRRTPSRTRSRDRDQQVTTQQRSGSLERVGGTGTSASGRRVSISPRRRHRSESPVTSTSRNPPHTDNSTDNRPVKMVSVPPTVSSLLTTEKGNNGRGGDANVNVTRVLVRRNVGGVGDTSSTGSRNIASRRSQFPAARLNAEGSSGAKSAAEGGGGCESLLVGFRTVASPRSRSPARSSAASLMSAKGGNNNALYNLGSISRHSSRKVEEHSPYRRTPLNDVDMNSLPFHPLAHNKASSTFDNNEHKSKEVEEQVNKHPLGLVAPQSKSNMDKNSLIVGFKGTHRRIRSSGAEGSDFSRVNYCRGNEWSTDDDNNDQMKIGNYDSAATPVADSIAFALPQRLTRSRSLRRSGDLEDSNVGSSLYLNPTTNYNSLLLQDIKNFHQQSHSSNYSVNTSTKSNLSCTTAASFSLPASLSRACSILEAVADLNSSSGNSNLCPDNRQKSCREFFYHTRG